jgi:DNA-binding MarR family transcriptional regulator
MNGIELCRLARRLAKLGVRAIPPSEFRDLPTSVRMVAIDVFDNPGTTISQIVDRTGFPQSHVSSAVARLRDSGVLVTASDPLDGRRTLVSPSAAQLERIARARHELVSVDEELAVELIDLHGAGGVHRVAEVVAALEMLEALLMPTQHLHLTATKG